MKKIITKKYWFLISIFSFTLFLLTSIHAQDYEVWVEAPPIFTLVRTQSINVYIKNLGASDNNYNVTYEASASSGLHLINIYMPINRTKTIKPGDVGSVLARVTLLGPIVSSGITFTVEPDSGNPPSIDKSINLITGSAINLPEFGLIGLIQLLILASLLLVVSYSSHFR